VLDRLVPALVGATVLATAAGSSSVPSITRAGSHARWVLLVLLLLAAAAWALPAWRRLPWQALAAAAAFAGLALLSAAWSVEPRTTAEKAVSLGLLFATCLALATAAAGQPRRAVSVLAGLLGGAAAVALAGLLVLAARHHYAVQPASYEAPARFKGFGQDPNTVGLLFALATPLATWATLRARSTVARVAAGAALLLLVGEIVATGSRGAIVAGALGAAVVVLVSAPRRLLALAVVVAAAVAAAGISTIPDPSQTAAPAAASAPAAAAPKPRPGYLDAEAAYPLNADVGQPLPGGGQPPVRRGLFATSGRVDAWRGAAHEAARRPLAGHGFGTEQAVFVDRFYRFVGSLPEDSYLGLALQLGVAGLLALLALVVVLARPGLRALSGPCRHLAGAGLGVLVAGLAIAVVQSYVYSVGNIAAGTLWIAAFLLPAVAANG
jgi:hypothetical protein